MFNPRRPIWTISGQQTALDTLPSQAHRQAENPASRIDEQFQALAGMAIAGRGRAFSNAQDYISLQETQARPVMMNDWN
jgi:hypothetical protein